MKKDKHITKVIFLYDPEFNEVFAFFPKLKYNTDIGLRMSYAHIGQHSPCDINYAMECKVCNVPSEHKALQDELESAGYNLNVLYTLEGVKY